MGFFNELGKKTAQTTNKIANQTRLKIKINEHKAKIDEIYTQIGKRVYEKYIREEDIKIKEDLEEQCKNLDSLSKEIEQARKEILRLSNKKMCKKCYAEIEVDAQYCSKCGEKQTGEKSTFEKAEEILQNTEVSQQNEKEKQIVMEELNKKNN